MYLADRGGHAYFIPEWARLATGWTIFGPLAGWLPTFAHTFAFASLTAAVLWPCPSLTGPICAGWFAIESLFELAQTNVVAGQVSALLDGAPTFRVVSHYFVAGTFDPLDWVSIGMGSAAAYLLARLLRKGGDKQCIVSEVGGCRSPALWWLWVWRPSSPPKA